MKGIDASRIRRSLMQHSAPYLDRVEVLPRVDSTNSYLKEQTAPPPGQFHVVIAEHQTAGRGRHERRWISSSRGSLCLSLAYRFQQSPRHLPALTLALGVSAADVLIDLGIADVALKWPNDVLVGAAKIGGILTETLFHGKDDVTVIAGIGLNMDLRNSTEVVEKSTWAGSATGLQQVMKNPPTRERLSRSIIEALMSPFRTFETHGFAPFIERFDSYDWLRGKIVNIETPEGPVDGICAGITDDGVLLVETNSGTRKIHTGSIRNVGEADAVQ